MQKTKLLFGSIIVVVLLGLYVYSLIEAIIVALCVPEPELNPGVSRTLATVGGLVSALVVAELAVTDPGETPTGRFLAPSGPNGQSSFRSGISVVYVVVWILFGLAGYVVGEMLYPGKVPALTDFAQAWLGVAVAAGYAYFGIKK
jgi:hypothetical protein